LNNTLPFQSKKIITTFFIIFALFFTTDFQAQNNALDFDGVDDYVNLGNILNLTSAISIETWVKTDGLGSRQTILDKGYSSSGEPYYQYHVEVRSGGEIYFALSLGGTRQVTQTSASLTAGQWHHVACVYSGSTIKVYIDGVEESSTTATGSISTYSTSLYIGAYSGPGPIGGFDGLIDEVRIWNDARTASEISTNMTNELNGNEAGLVAYYKFNESDTNTVASNFASATGASYDGALTNMTGTEWTASTVFAPTISSVTANWGDFLTEVEDSVNGTVTVVTSGVEDGQTVTLTLNSVNYTGNVSLNSASITVTAADLQALSNNTDYILTTNVSDIAGNTATTHTSTTFKALNNPSANNALAFDGTNDYVAAGITLPTGDFTYSAWVKFNTAARKESIFSIGGDNELIIIKNTDGELAVWIGGSEVIRDSSTTDTAWHHITLTRSGVNATLYRDGVSIGSTTSAPIGALSFGSCNLLIGSDSDDGCTGSMGDYLDGQIDEMRIWNDVRTTSEISANMNSELTGNEGNLVAYYKFNEPDTNTVSSNFASATGASYDGALTNMTGTEWITSTAFVVTVGTFTNFSGDNQWDTASNWSSGNVPTSSTNITISSGQTIEAGSTTTAVVNNLTIDSGGSFTIASNSNLTLTGNFTNNGTVTLNSDSDEFSSIIVGGTSTGNIIYNRYVNIVGVDEWDLIGPPVSGLSINSFITETNNAAAIATNGSGTYAVGSYDNTSDTWTNATTSTAGNLNLGQGYQMATTSGTTLAFTGTVATADQTVAIQNNDAVNSGAGRRWNLVANPFPSYIYGNVDADATNNFLTVNTLKLDDSFEAIYGYDADGTGYTIYNQISSTALYIAPGQAFFIAAANTNSDTVSFTEAMQTVTGGDDFIAARSVNTSYQLDLEIHNNTSKIGATQFYFKEGLTLGLDPGYDAGAFNQTAPISSRLVEEEQGINFSINAMSVAHMNSTIIPLAIHQEEGQEIKVSIANNTLSEDINVYLEDTLNGTMTLLQEQDFELTTQNEISGAGRFYIHLTTTVLANEDSLNTSLVKVFKGAGNNFVSIEGLRNKATIKLYNILGKEVRIKTLISSNETLSTNGLSSGIYVIQLKSNNQLLTKKIQID